MSLMRRRWGALAVWVGRWNVHQPPRRTAFTMSMMARLEWAASFSLLMSDAWVEQATVGWTLVSDSLARSSCWPVQPAADPSPAVTTAKGRSPRLFSFAARLSSAGISATSRMN